MADDSSLLPAQQECMLDQPWHDRQATLKKGVSRPSSWQRRKAAKLRQTQQDQAPGKFWTTRAKRIRLV